jgi:hypothetical protein
LVINKASTRSRPKRLVFTVIVVEKFRVTRTKRLRERIGTHADLEITHDVGDTMRELVAERHHNAVESGGTTRCRTFIFWEFALGIFLLLGPFRSP